MRKSRSSQNATLTPTVAPKKRCAIYTRKSTDEGLDQEFNSLHAQREACEAYVASQRHEGWTLVPTLFDDGGYSGGTMLRPGLQALLTEVDAGRIDVVVVYKVDRLTRSLPDFAKIVERFDAEGVSFVSVTQSFNTTTSMGRLTLNVLLSFAQFEREVGAERTRDKIAASKKKGLWMGGPVPLGYRVENRKLLIHDEEAIRVRAIFTLYLEAGSIPALLPILRNRNIRTAQRFRADSSTTGDKVFTAGGLSHLLRNRIYLGELSHKGNWHDGEHAAIMDPALFDAVQQHLNRGAKERRQRTQDSGLLTGLIYDSAGNRMTSVHTNKKGVRYRYYISRAFAEGRPQEAGTPSRVSAPAIEAVVLSELDKRRLLDASHEEELAPRAQIEAQLTEIKVFSNKLRLSFCSGEACSIPWQPHNTKPQRKIYDASERDTARAENRTRLIIALHKARQWLNGLASGAVSDIDAITQKESKTPRSIRMLINLAFLAPDLIEKTIAGSLAAEMTVTDLAQNLPISWREQRKYLGVNEE